MNKAETLTKMFETLHKDLVQFMPLIKGEMLSYRTLESQESQQIAINESWKQKNAEAEEQFKKTVQASSTVDSENRKKDAELNAFRNTLWVKANAKFKEIEKLIEEADRARIKKSLKELEAIAA